MKGDFAEVHQMMRGIDYGECLIFPRIGELRTREHKFQVREERQCEFEGEFFHPGSSQYME